MLHNIATWIPTLLSTVVTVEYYICHRANFFGHTLIKGISSIDRVGVLYSHYRLGHFYIVLHLK